MRTLYAILLLSLSHPLLAEFRVIPVESPAPADSQCSNLATAPDGTLLLTWYGPGDKPEERALRFARLAPGAGTWSTPRTIASTSLLMENWADFASLAVGTDGALIAQWFQRASPDARGYEGWYSRSEDGGLTWRTPARLGHEFVALAPLSGGRTLAVWLESARVRAAQPVKRDPAAPRAPRDPHAPYIPSMKLLARLLSPDGSSLGEWTVDPDVCTCCQNTAAVLPGDRVFVGYRGHTPDEIRDSKYALFDLATLKWSTPATLRDDGWKIAACPVNGPAADAFGDSLAVAWFSAADGVPRVQARASADAGRTLSAPVVIDLGKPLGRLETVSLDDGTSIILWLEIGTVENTAGIYARRLWPDNALSDAALVAASSQARASGFPRAALRRDGRVLMSWTQLGEKPQVRTLQFDPRTLTRSSRSLSSSRPASGSSRGAALEFCDSPVTQTHSVSTQ